MCRDLGYTIVHPSTVIIAPLAAVMPLLTVGLYTLTCVVAPIALPDEGTKKLLAFTLPSDPLAPARVEKSTLRKELFDQLVLLLSHEFPLDFDPLTRLTWALVLTAAMLLLSVDFELRMLKPLSPLSHAVFRSKVSEPGLPLSMKPFLALAKAIEFRMMWFAGGLSVIPSLKPFPSPLKEEKPHLLKPFPQAYTSSIWEHSSQNRPPEEADSRRID